MAKIECSINTEDKSIEVTVDGKKVDNFGYMSIYAADSPFGYNFSMASIEEMDDCTKTTYWSHSNTKEFVSEIDDFLRSLSKKDMDEDDMPAKKGKKKKKEGEDDKDVDEMMTTDEKKKC